VALSYHVPRELRTIAFAAGTLLQVTLATKMHSLARYSKRTLQHRSAVADYNYKISGSFYSLLRVLFNVTSRYWYAIGLKTCLVLEVNASQFPASYPRDSTQDTTSTCLVSRTGLSPCFAFRSRKVLITKRHRLRGPITPHLRFFSEEDSVWTIPLSVALTHGISFDFFSCWY
jgi:hypothetical protein